MSEVPGRRDGPSSASKGYEQRDVAVGQLAIFGLGLGVVTLACFFAMWAMFGHLAKREAQRSHPASLLSEAAGHRLPPLPRLEPNLPARLAELHRHEDAVLGTYGWVDRERGVIRVPIERAMDLLVERLTQAKRDTARDAAAADRTTGDEQSE